MSIRFYTNDDGNKPLFPNVMKSNDKIIHNGTAFYTVSATAKLLKITHAQVRELMTKGELKWIQLRTDGKVYASASSILSHPKCRLK